jgi:hypothetical protein
MIGFIKTLIRRTLGRKMLPKNEMEAFIKEVAAVTNERPLTLNSQDIKDHLPLTPNKLVFGRNILPVPHPDVNLDEDSTDLTYLPTNSDTELHWKGRAKRHAHFTKQFNEEYLAMLRQRHIYENQLDPQVQADIQAGDLVILYDEGHRLMWKKAVVLELLPGQDAQTRVARIQTANTTTTRPISRLYPLRKATELQAPQDEEPQNTDTDKPTELLERDSEEEPTIRPRRAAAVKAALNIQQCLSDEDEADFE